MVDSHLLQQQCFLPSLNQVSIACNQSRSCDVAPFHSSSGGDVARSPQADFGLRYIINTYLGSPTLPRISAFDPVIRSSSVDGGLHLEGLFERVLRDREGTVSTGSAMETTGVDAMETRTGGASDSDVSTSPDSLKAKQLAALKANKMFIPSYTDALADIYTQDSSYQADPHFYEGMFHRAIQGALDGMADTYLENNYFNTSPAEQAQQILQMLSTLVDFGNPLAPRSFTHEVMRGRWAQFEQDCSGRVDIVWVHWGDCWSTFPTRYTPL